MAVFTIKRSVFLCALFAILYHSTMVSAAVNEWSDIGPNGGYITYLEISPSDEKVIYATADNGAIFKSIDAGLSWTSNRVSFSAAAIAIDPVDPGIIYAGERTTQFSTYIHKSTDAGVTWTKLQVDANRSPNALGVLSISIDPTNADIVYVSNGTDTYKSVDAGESWVKTGFSTLSNTKKVLLDPANSNTVYAFGPGIQKSIDGGFSAITLDTYGSGITSTIDALAIDPKNSNILYAASRVGLFKSVDGGITWSFISSIAMISLAVDLIDSNIVYAGGFSGFYRSTDGGGLWQSYGTLLAGFAPRQIKIHQNQANVMYANTSSWGVMRTTNNGIDWVKRNNGIKAHEVISFAADPKTPGILYAGTKVSGVFKTTDGGTSWNAMNTGLTSSYISALVINPANPDTLFAGISSDYGPFFRSMNGGASWTKYSSGLPTLNNRRAVESIAVDPVNPSILYMSLDNATIYKSSNSGTSWSLVATLGSTYSDIVRHISIDPSDPKIIYASTHNSIFKSVNTGLSWTKIYSMQGEFITSKVVVDPNNSDNLYASAGRKIRKSTDGGMTWKTYDRGILSHTMGLAIHPVNANTIFASGGFYIYQSTDAGLTWLRYGKPLSYGVTHAMVTDPHNADILYATNRGGISQIEDLGGVDKELLSTSNTTYVPSGSGGGGGGCSINRSASFDPIFLILLVLALSRLAIRIRKPRSQNPGQIPVFSNIRES